ncbi:MAG: recombinase RecT [Kiloniellales bacterium]|nr:recombinase RecT [Kiloniellales bacterium]
MSDDTALVRDPKERRKHLVRYLHDRSSVLAGMCRGRELNSDRLIDLAVAAATQNPKLLECTPASWVMALMDSAWYGIEPNPHLALGYLVPYQNRKRNVREVQFMLGYKGLMTLAYESAKVTGIFTRLVYERDDFSIAWEREWEGSAPFVHRPSAADDRGDVTHVYTVIVHEQRLFSFHPLTRREVDFYRSKSQRSDDGPWRDHWAAMARKTSIRRALADLPIRSGSPLEAVIRQERARDDGQDGHLFSWDGENAPAGRLIEENAHAREG